MLFLPSRALSPSLRSTIFVLCCSCFKDKSLRFSSDTIYKERRRKEEIQVTFQVHRYIFGTDVFFLFVSFLRDKQLDAEKGSKIKEFF